jgi:ACT domain-containing protein
MLRVEDYFGGKRLQLPLMDHVVHAAVRDKILMLLDVVGKAEVADLQELAVGPDHT